MGKVHQMKMDNIPCNLSEIHATAAMYDCDGDDEEELDYLMEEATAMSYASEITRNAIHKIKIELAG